MKMSISLIITAKVKAAAFILNKWLILIVLDSNALQSKIKFHGENFCQYLVILYPEPNGRQN